MSTEKNENEAQQIDAPSAALRLGVSHILLDAPDSSDAIARIFRHRKAGNPKVSLQQICRKAGIPSSGYLSDVMTGKRRLHLKYREPMAAALALTEHQGAFLGLLVELDHCRNDAERDQLMAQKEELAKILATHLAAIPGPLSGNVLFHMIVFSAFSLFDGKPTLADLERFFGPVARIGLRDSLCRLSKLGLIAQEGEHYTHTQHRVIFSKSDDGLSHIQFLKESIMDAARKVDKWYGRKGESCMMSTLISVRKSELAKKISQIKARILEMQSSLDTDSGDGILRFNVQIYPFDPEDLKG